MSNPENEDSAVAIINVSDDVRIYSFDVHLPCLLVHGTV